MLLKLLVQPCEVIPLVVLIKNFESIMLILAHFQLHLAQQMNLVCFSVLFGNYIVFISLGNNFEYWGNNQENPPSPKRRRPQTPDGDPERKRSPNNTSGFDSLTSPRDSNRDSLGQASPAGFEISNGKSDIKVTINENVTSISELIKCCPPTWSGGLILKSSGFATRMYFCSGEIQLVDLMKDSSEHAMLRITQRLRLEQSKLEDVSRRISSSGSSGHCILIASQASNLQLNFSNCGNGNGGGGGNSGDESVNAANLQQRPIRNLVTYLKSKDAAGVVLASEKSSTLFGEQSEASKGVLYLFPPHAYSIELIQKIAPNITAESAAKEDYLVVVLVRGSN